MKGPTKARGQPQALNLYGWIALRRALLFTSVAVSCAIGYMLFSPQAAAQSRSLPSFEVDPAWPRVPAKWKLGHPSSIAIDAQDNVWVLTRPRTLLLDTSVTAAPAIVVFSNAGEFIKAWGGKGNGYEWPGREHGIHIDNKGYVWVGGNNCPALGLPGLMPLADDALLKFTQDGKFVLQIGKSNASKGDTDTVNVHRAADAWVYARTNDVGGAKGIFIVDRKTLDVLGIVQVPGQLGPGHHIAVDSKGNLYIAQTGAGLQKLVFKGMSPAK